MFSDSRITFLIFLTVAYPAWARGGTPPAWLPPLAAFAVLLLFMTWTNARVRPVPAAPRPAKDPVLYGCLGLLLLTMVQWLNAGRYPVPGPAGQWAYSLPPVPFLPGAVTPEDGRMVLIWFLAAAAVMLALRYGPARPELLKRLAWLIPVNAHLLVAIGLVQRALGAKSVYGLIPMEGPFFAAFGYVNHAGTFFMVLFFWTAGWALYYRQGHRPKAALAWALLLAPCLSAVHATSCRAAILMIWTTLVAALLVWVVRQSFRMTAKKRGLALVLTIILLAGVWAGAVGPDARPVVRVAQSAKTWLAAADGTLAGQWTDRAWQVKSAWRIFLDYPLLGAGGNSYQYFAPLYIKPGDAPRRHLPGQAFVHNDPVQFLSEFGLFGAGCMIAVLIGLFTPIVRQRKNVPLFLAVPLIGVFFAGLHSLIDLPFRCPAVLVTVAVIPALAGRYAVSQAENSPPVHH